MYGYCTQTVWLGGDETQGLRITLRQAQGKSSGYATHMSFWKNLVKSKYSCLGIHRR